jgi:hypothetical protein
MTFQYKIHQLTQDDLELMDELLSTFGVAFGDEKTYTGKRPAADYMRRLFKTDYFIALAALNDNEVVGGLAAYELKKFEQERSEIYIYDVAVVENHRRNKLLKINGGVEEGRTPDLCIANAELCIFRFAQNSIKTA